MAKIRILMVDDHALFRAALRAILERQDDMALVGEAGSADAALALAAQLAPDIVLMDLNLPQRNGIEVTREILAAQPWVKVIALTMYHDDDMIAAAIRAGVVGYLLKGIRAAELLQAIRLVAAGGAALDPAVAHQVLVQYRQLSAEAKPGRNEI